MLCCQVRLKALEMLPADQAFDRVAAEIALLVFSPRSGLDAIAVFRPVVFGSNGRGDVL
jgi:hypothetical protein